MARHETKHQAVLQIQVKLDSELHLFFALSAAN